MSKPSLTVGLVPRIATSVNEGGQRNSNQCRYNNSNTISPCECDTRDARGLKYPDVKS